MEAPANSCSGLNPTRGAGAVDPWLMLESGPGTAAFNMALDEALLNAMPHLAKPVLRFYSWTEPAASFGYFQRYADIKQATLLRPLVRRPTGGGLVPHAADWTYSVAFPVTHEWYGLSAAESYQRIHEWIQAAFAHLGIQTVLATESRQNQLGQCFVGYVKSDVLWQGRKIAGAAQRRTRSGLLIQGSVQSPFSLPRGAWQRAMSTVAQAMHGVAWSDLGGELPVHEQARLLAEQKYSQPSYNRKR